MIVSFGSIALDTTRTPSLTMKDILGGSCTYFSLASSLFFKTGIVGIVGSDFPKNYLEIFSNRLDLSGFKIEKSKKTFKYDSSFGNDLSIRTTNITELNVYKDYNPELPYEYRKASYIYLGNSDPKQQLQVIDQLEKPRYIFMDTIDFWIKTERSRVYEVIQRVNGLFLNEEEIKLLCETNSVLRGASKLLDLNIDLLVVKRGARGAVMFTRNFVFINPSYLNAEVVDPTGAGDSFAGGFLGHIVKKDKIDDKTLKESLIYGNILGSFAIERFGPERLISLTLKEIDERYRKHCSMVFF
jgi:sugar/nucleoside kinase (ribokinase family)